MADIQEPKENGTSSESQVNGTESSEASEAQEFAVVCRLLSEGAPLVMRDIFNRIYPPITLSDSLERPEITQSLRRLKAHGTLTQQNWDVLYPSNKKAARSMDYDVTLLGVLLRQVCHLTPPYPHGWEAWPVDADTSLSADLARISCYRQLLASYHRNQDNNLTSADLKKYFEDICGIYKRLSPSLRLDVSNIQTQALDSRAQDHYAKAVVNWQHTAFGVSASESEMRLHKDSEMTRSSTTGLERSLSNHPSNTSQTAMTAGGMEMGAGHHSPRSVSKRSFRDVPTLSKEEMTKFERSILQKFHKRIVDSVHSDDVVGRLIQRSVFTHENKNKINLATKNSERMRIVLDLLSKKGGKCFDIFCDTIKFKYKGLYDQLVQAKKAPFVQEKPDEVNLCRDALRSQYQTRYSEYSPIAWYKTARAPFEDCYVTPYITDHEGRDLNPENLFEGHSKCITPKRLLVTGQSGVGKSTMCRHLVYEWSKGGDATINKRFKLVFLLDLRRVTSDLVDSVIEQCLPISYRHSHKELSDILEKNQKNVLFILDGFEDLAPSDTEVLPLIYKDLYKHCNIILTANSNVPNQSLAKYFDTKLMLMGLKRTQAAELLEVYNRLTAVSKDSLNALQVKVSSEQDSILSVLAQNPFYCLCMCLIVEMGGGLDFKTRSGLLQEFAACMPRLYCQQNYVHMPEGRVPDAVNETLAKLKEFAYKTLLDQCVIFQTADVTALHPNTDADLFSIFETYQTWSGSRPLFRSCFSSRILQEYLAASYLSELEPEEAENAISPLFSEKQLRQAAIFYSSFLKTDSEETLPLAEAFFNNVASLNRKLWRGVTIISGSGDSDGGQRSEGRVNDFKLCFDCLEECQGHDEALEVIAPSIPTRLIIKRREVLSGHTLRGLSWLLGSARSKVTELDLTLDHFNLYEEYSILKLAHSVEQNQLLHTLRLRWREEHVLARLLARVFGSNQSIRCVKVWDETKEAADNISAMVWSNLRSACINMRSVREFAFMDCKNPALVTSTVRNSPDTLEELCLSGCDLDLVGSQQLGMKIENSQTLHTLDLTGARFKRPDFLHIANGIRLTKSLRELILADSRLDRDSIDALAEALIFNNSLKSLDLSRMALTDNYCQVIGHALATNKWLSEVRFADCDVSEEGVAILRGYKRKRLRILGLAGRRSLRQGQVNLLSRETTDLSFCLSQSTEGDYNILVA